MKKAGFWKTDWFFGIVVSVVMLILGNGELLQGLERKAYDKGVAATTRTPSDKVAVIAIDEQSIANIGRWPWSREIMAEMVEKLAAAKAKVIATTVFYSEPQRDPGLVYINKLIETCGVSLPATVAAADRGSPARGGSEIEYRPPPGGRLRQGGQCRLADVVRAGRAARAARQGTARVCEEECREADRRRRGAALSDAGGRCRRD
jgi:hypothetical protein